MEDRTLRLERGGKMFSVLLLAIVAQCSDEPEICYPGLQRLLPMPLSMYSGIDEILMDLPENFRSSFSLVRKGSGLQPGTDEFPRVVMTSCEEPCDKPFPVIAFHGNPEGRNYNTLEVAEFDPKKNALNFFVIREQNLGLEFSNPNPKECTNCHFKKPKLIWSSYPLWPTLYRPAIHQLPSESERELLEKFWATRDENARYQFLGDKADVFLSDDPSINPNYEFQELPDDPGSLRIVGVARAMQVIESGTLKRNIRSLKNYRYLKYTLAGIFSDCSIEDLIPWELGDVFPDDFGKFAYLNRIARSKRHPDHRQVINYADIVTPQLLYFLTHLGLEPESWFGEGRLSKDKKQYLMVDPTNSAWASAREIVLDDDTRPFYERRENFGGWPSAMVYNCEGIGALSRNALLELYGLGF